MRGKVVASAVLVAVSGITPAYAGKRGQLSDSVTGQWDHPRLCGEKHIPAAECSNRLGSPPPMRGKESRRRYGFQISRITPAYAGKSSRSHASALVSWDHPRLCGEKGTALAQSEHVRGSPPPMRGKVAGIAALIAIFGITPAYAGKSTAVHLPGFFSRDHPRLCGEKCTVQNNFIWCLGSPPPMRGKVSM